MRHRYSVFFLPLHILADFFCLNAAFVLAYNVKFGSVSAVAEPPYATLWLVFNLVWLVIAIILKPYNFPRQLFKIDHLLKKQAMVIGVHVAAIAVYWVFTQAYYYSRDHLFYTYILFFLLGAAYRIGGLLFLREYRARGYNNRRYVVVGYGKLSKTITRFYDIHPEMGFRFCGFFDHSSSENRLALKGGYEDLATYIRDNQIDCVYCCLPYIDNTYLRQIVDNADDLDYQVKLLVDFRGFLSRGTSVEYHDFLPVLNLSSQILEDFRVNALKRAFDILFSLGVIVLGSPIFVAVALATRLSSKGPIFYAQERVGREGIPFTIYKFRSMYVNSEKAGPSLSQGLQDNRITPWGRFMRRTRLDELPQFFNVLKGDMSVVGPRPERQYFIDQIVEIAPEYRDLLKVKPGITSIGQVKFGYAANVDEMVKRLRFDLLYPERRSFGLDIWIIVQTVRVMMQGRGQ
ncbi:exopolysaccharide biosynthesis polyprenyl glycosylphosphotransferase [Rudanella paleaurantiibacter]|uniref:Exopolysaccharide biosynthesis polyprenyl glycosylphosphotransferase n=1 Tax=Rudanella paleaurantiibacter TaxID=2614655 RepID=A0A7J5TXR0_9BACT|nr:exopolysaccharide biosynthesis polyprenyl glycosylphosphotransferase [Rudanella paleaurantiibacter]KAB7729367.1 exopolysaccharide biosynthesis polyprenyl glycosylphosphotransferase [Rudanella paleaurantiibacter]